MIVLEEMETEFGHIKITRSAADGTLTYHINDCFHSEASGNGVSTCVYIHVMHSIIRQSGAQHVLMIGCAGGTLATMLHEIGCRVTVVDINPHAFTLAKKYFRMPDAVKCIIEDGWTYLLKTPVRYDAIAVDVFTQHAVIPPQFTTEGFFRIAAHALNSNGVVVMNCLMDHDMDKQADQLAQAMQEAELPAVVFDWPGKSNRNAIIVGGTMRNIQISSRGAPSSVQKDLNGIVRRAGRRV